MRKTAWNSITAAAAISLMVGILLIGCKKAPELRPKPVPPTTPIKTKGLIDVGYGWSLKDGEREAAEEAISMMKEGLGAKSPDYAILFSTVGYDSEALLSEVRKLLPGVQIYGGTSCLGVLSKDGFHIGEKGSLVLLGISSKRITFGVGGVSIDDFPSAREAGEAAVKSALEAAGEEGLPKIILMTAAPGEEEDILAGIEEIVGKDVPVFGGSSGDNDLSGKWRQFANDKVYSNGISLTAIYTDLKIGWALEAGYLRTENRGTITKAEGRTIYEIDGQPAAEVYNDWTGGIVTEELKAGGPVLHKTTFYPLAKVIKKGGKEFTISIHPLSIDASNHSLTVFANVEKGDEVLLMHGDWELILNRCLTTPLKALESEGFSKGDVSFAIYDYCAGTMLAIPEEERPKMPGLIRRAIGNAPFIGTFTFGEQGYIRGIGNYHNNLVNWMIVFTEKEA